jgi:hypothetical protein
MAQAYGPIRAALDAQALTTTGLAASGASTNYYSENITFSLANLANSTTGVYVRSTQIPVSPETSTIGVGGYDKLSGIFAFDVMGNLHKGTSIVTSMADALIATFPRGLIIPLTGGGAITVETTGMAPITQGAWAMNKLYCQQVQVKWFGYFSP